jgi:hypothetical protein
LTVITESNFGLLLMPAAQGTRRRRWRLDRHARPLDSHAGRTRSASTSPELCIALPPLYLRSGRPPAAPAWASGARGQPKSWSSAGGLGTPWSGDGMGLQSPANGLAGPSSFASSTCATACRRPGRRAGLLVPAPHAGPLGFPAELLFYTATQRSLTCKSVHVGGLNAGWPTKGDPPSRPCNEGSSLDIEGLGDPVTQVLGPGSCLVCLDAG